VSVRGKKSEKPGSRTVKIIFPILLLALISFAVGCSKDSLKQGMQRGMYEGLTENRRLNNYPDKSADAPLSYDQYQVERQHQLEKNKFSRISTINEHIRDLLDHLGMERLEDNLFRGESRDIGSRSIFGGQVLGQVFMADHLPA
jgi:hypothetical protein